MRVDVYRRKGGRSERLGSLHLEDGKVVFDPTVEWVRKIGVPPTITPNDGEAYLRAIAGLMARGTLHVARLVED